MHILDLNLKAYHTLCDQFFLCSYILYDPTSEATSISTGSIDFTPMVSTSAIAAIMYALISGCRFPALLNANTRSPI